MASDPFDFIGKPVSITSLADLRYEGILYTIDKVKKAIALKDVRCFGTEGRSAREVPPSSDVHPFLLFYSTQIKECVAIEESNPYDDPAIISAPMEPPQVSHTQPPAPSSAPSSVQPSSTPVKESSPSEEQPSQKPHKQYVRRHQQQSWSVDKDQDFDFAASNQMFDKKEFFDATSDAKSLKVSYNPEDDFFDTLEQPVTRGGGYRGRGRGRGNSRGRGRGRGGYRGRNFNPNYNKSESL
ncbi:hypothetical protein RCL1_002754 [Eukaryota sp. TZLM3-RCL]